YSMIPWTNRVRYRDEATGSDAWLTLEYDKPSYDAIWKPFLQDFVKHLREKKLLGRVRIAMDERPEALMRPAMAVLRQYAPEIGLALAGSNEPGLKNDIDDWCVYLEPSLDTAIARERRERGVVTTFYTCTGPEQPNTFTYSPPAEAAWLPIYAAARDYDGYLRWAYDSWTEDPLHDTKHVSWQAGDAFLIYPGARSSIRFERLREGIQEFEKIRILRSNAAIANSTERKALDAALAKMTIEDVRARPAAQPVGEAKAAILALSRAAAR
ncbi:MAG: DUF4091 domain-containing protein, partial [Anaerolineaceae bacterium]